MTTENILFDSAIDDLSFLSEDNGTSVALTTSMISLDECAFKKCCKKYKKKGKKRCKSCPKS